MIILTLTLIIGSGTPPTADLRELSSPLAKLRIVCVREPEETIHL